MPFDACINSLLVHKSNDFLRKKEGRKEGRSGDFVQNLCNINTNSRDFKNFRDLKE